MRRKKGPRTLPRGLLVSATPAAAAATAPGPAAAARPAAAGPAAGAARAALRLGPRLVDDQVAVAEQPAVEHLDGLGRFLFCGHLDEPEAARAAGELVGHDAHRLHRAGLSE